MVTVPFMCDAYHDDASLFPQQTLQIGTSHSECTLGACSNLATDPFLHELFCPHRPFSLPDRSPCHLGFVVYDHG